MGWLRERAVATLEQNRDEERALLRMLREAGASERSRILDVGCGYGAKIRLLRSVGLDATGVDINAALVEANRRAGLSSLTVDEFRAEPGEFDLLLFFHVVEHFPPGDLLGFLESYLDRLRPGGHVIVATPLLSAYFFDDFDHVRPYNPTGFEMVFGAGAAQVQYYSRHRLELRDLWFRRGAHRLKFFRGLYLPRYSKLPIVANLVLALLFRASLGLIGRTDGWMGLYRKTGP